jgi:hypothetical protein
MPLHLETGSLNLLTFGETWFETTLMDNDLFSVYNVLAINNDTIFVATEKFLRYSYDGSENWYVTNIITGFSGRLLYNYRSDLYVSDFMNSKNLILKSENYGQDFIELVKF